MKITRLANLSIVYAIKDKLHSYKINTESSLRSSLTDWLYINVINSFPKDFSKITLPTIAVFEDLSLEDYFQIGGNFLRNQTFIVDIYSQFHGQANDLADIVLEVFESDVELRDYNVSFPTYSVQGTNIVKSGDPTILRQIGFDNIRAQPITRQDIGEVLAHRKRISVEALYIT